MYATCLFCNKPLGSNQVLETFPVGRRLAFDPAKGRLWVVCTECERWNLSPLEERWEAIEQAERLYRDTRRRVATDHIGLAKLNDGTVLVRIGEPLRPEFAAWRYGDQFGRRRRRQMLIAGAGVTALSALVVGGAVAGASIGGFGWMIAQSGRALIYGRAETVVARIPTSVGTVDVRRRHLAETRITRGTQGPIAIDLRYKNGQSHFEGREALRIASIVIPQINRFGGAKETIAQAVSELESSGGAEGYLDQLSKFSHVATAPAAKSRRGHRGVGSKGLWGLKPVHRLALEMALHEDSERRAVEGELTELERAWREAEEIAAISDDLLLPGGIRGALDRLRGK
jgi:hypothetical protein